MRTRLYIFPHGIGDGMMATAVAANYRRQFGLPMHIGHKDSCLFEGNPDVVCHDEYAIQLLTPQVIGEASNRGFELICLYYYDFVQVSDKQWRFYQQQEKFVSRLCSLAGLSGMVDIRPRIYLTDEEITFGQSIGEGAICIISQGVEEYKTWPLEKTQAVVRAFPDRRIVQLGAPNDWALKDVEDYRGKFSLRQVASVLRASRLFVGPVGALMHIARAVDCPSVILMPSAEIGGMHYTAFNNIGSQSPCLECLSQRRNIYACNHPEHCLGDVDVEQVVKAISDELGQERKELPAEYDSVEAKSAIGLDLLHMRNSFVKTALLCFAEGDSLVATRQFLLDDFDYSFVLPSSVKRLVLPHLDDFIYVLPAAVDYVIDNAFVLSLEGKRVLLPWSNGVSINLPASTADVNKSFSFAVKPMSFLPDNLRRSLAFRLKSMIAQSNLFARVSYRLKHNSPIQFLKRAFYFIFHKLKRRISN
jgi:hypothetical protein